MRFFTIPRLVRDGVAGLAIAGVITLTAALAAEDPMMDADGDGLVSYTEAVAVYPVLSETKFQALDADGNGGLDAPEIAAARQAGVMKREG